MRPRRTIEPFCLATASLILALSRHAEAEEAAGRMLAALRSPTATVSAGVVLPLFRLYELPGPWVGVSLGWELNAHTTAIASVDVGTLFTDGARQYLGSLGVGVRVSPWHRGPVWMQLGLGMTGYVERIGVVLPDKMVSSTTSGAMITGDLCLGVSLNRWEIAVGYDHIARTSSYYQLYDGDEELPFLGTGMLWVGRQL